MHQEIITIDCAVIYAGNEVMLAIEPRHGRHPALLRQADEHIQWECADGKIEQIALREPYGEADKARLIREIKNDSLLVAEFRDMKNLHDQPALHWTLAPVSQQARERQS